MSLAGRLLVVAMATMATSLPAVADGRVERAKGCGDKIFVASGDGYSVLVGSGPEGISEGDTLVGDIDRIGHTLVYDRNTGRSVSATVEEHALDKTQITQRIAASCRSFLASTFARGSVERTIGCGNKIFVNTNQGYAVLERLAGGIVAEGDQVTGDFNRAGRATIEDTQSGAILTVFVDDYRLSKSAAQHRMAISCRR